MIISKSNFARRADVFHFLEANLIFIKNRLVIQLCRASQQKVKGEIFSAYSASQAKRAVNLFKLNETPGCPES